MITLYGISNCDTVKKARKLLDDRRIDYQFHDFRKQGLDARQVNTWLKGLGIDQLINKRSRTWKTLSATQQAALQTAKAADLVLQHPTLIKRPLLEISAGKSPVQRLVGFDKDRYLALFS